jgi:hypothetical protein
MISWFQSLCFFNCNYLCRYDLECVQELPVKTPVYATLVGLLNARVPEFVEEVVRTAIEHLEASLKSSDLSDKIRARLLLRFIAILPTVVGLALFTSRYFALTKHIQRLTAGTVPCNQSGDPRE